ncbi:YdaS family helix-turn-helix protein [Methylorubrum aminovorans]|uniref:YdaS family helix-turn-helix protein n=1 Tax=Methylorubrum aminovorans TaxID=269069 RepID=UPI003D66C228
MGTHQTHPIIAQAIKHFGSQDRMAKAVGSSQSTISRMLLGEMPIPAQIAVALDRARACRHLSQSSVAARQRTPVKLTAVFS